MTEGSIYVSPHQVASGGRGSAVRSISGPTVLLLKAALSDWADEASIDVRDLNKTTREVLAFCVGQVALVLSGNLSYSQ